MDKITLYSTNCPKCKVVSKKLEMKNIQFDTVEAKGRQDVIDMLAGKGFKSMPVLEVDNNFMDFSTAVKWIGEQS